MVTRPDYKVAVCDADIGGILFYDRDCWYYIPASIFDKLYNFNGTYKQQTSPLSDSELIAYKLPNCRQLITTENWSVRLDKNELIKIKYSCWCFCPKTATIPAGWVQQSEPSQSQIRLRDMVYYTQSIANMKFTQKVRVPNTITYEITDKEEVLRLTYDTEQFKNCYKNLRFKVKELPDCSTINANHPDFER